MVDIDGSHGEGGGQVLRSALSLSLITGKPVQIRNIRAGRKKPGLMPQHLKALEAAAAVGSARVEGARPGGTTVAFVPGAVRPGSYRFEIGTAGSTALLLQTILLPLSLARAPSHLAITGGTHVPWSPCFDYLQRQWIPCLRQSGLDVRVALEKTGFYPRGGGAIRASVGPAGRLHPLTLKERGGLVGISCLSTVTGLDRSIAERQMQRVRSRLGGRFPLDGEIAILPGPGKGTLVLLLAQFEHSRCCYFALGERGKPAERVADEAVQSLEGFLASGGAVDPYLADQLILPLVFADGTSEIRTAEITGHLVTNIWVVRQFLPVEIDLHGSQGEAGLVVIRGRGDRI